MFKQIEAIPNLPEQEKKTIEYWQKIDVVNLLKKTREDKKAPERVYYDGPITANGMPHYGHAITWTMKDIIPRYWSMQGNLVYRNMGWDCQGIPVEYEIEKELKFEKKEDIEAFGVAKFNDLCRQSVMKNREAMFYYETKLGRWFDETQSYSTMEPKYIESMWWSLKELYKKGLLYEGHKVVAYSTRAGTTLSTHEVNDGGYKEIEDPYVTVKFKLTEASKSKLLSKVKLEVGQQNMDVFILAWTTTPWTIPGNLLLSVGKDIKYVLAAGDDGLYVLAGERVEPIFKDKNVKVKANLTALDLIGLEYTPPFGYFKKKRAEGCFKIVEAGHTSTEEGTGLVHLAPYGAEDFEVFMSLGIQLFDYLDDTANFTSMIPEYAGLFYKKANPKIVEDLRARGRLLDNGTLVHRMPMCWRTGTPLIYKPVKSWYIATTKIKARMAEENQKLNWLPEHIKDGNSGIWINNARDWALSRSRYWGTPLPVWVNDKTGEKLMVGSFAELKDLSGVELTDPHKPFVDEITWEDKKNGGTFRRVKDVIDVWYDSASMPFAQYHYPFENKEKFGTHFPAEYISEGLDQIRLWFYVMHVLGVAIFDKVPYKTVVVTGTMLNDEGKKMSKSKRNYKPMDEILETYGGDVLRYFILTSPLVYGEDAIFDEKYLAEGRKEFFLPLWNSLKYFLTYADLHKFKPTLDRPVLPKESKYYDLDLWILARLKEVSLSVTQSMESYKIMDAARGFTPFISDLSTWYIRRSRDRIKDGDKQALAVLYYILCQLTKLMAPFLPFISETVYEILGLRELTGQVSVHMDLLNKTEVLTEDDKAVLVKMHDTRDVVTLALSIRMKEGIKVRQPLQKLLVISKEEREVVLAEDLITDEVNVKSVELQEMSSAPAVGDMSKYKDAEDAGFKVSLDTSVSEDLRLEGLARETIRAVQELRKTQKFTITDKVVVILPENEDNRKIVERYGDEVKAKVLAVELSLGENLTVTKS